MSETVYQIVTRIVAKQLSLEIDEIKSSDRFKDDLKVDSIEMVELVMAFEDEFGQTISDEDAATIVTIQDAVNYIERLQK